ncbi:hypothetical protein [Alteromonas sp. A079]|uniref:hypothetical protein n=1 Tax=Alteromonas sp. A079 TaxID=3410268 RepID=UPI003BA30FD9
MPVRSFVLITVIVSTLLGCSSAISPAPITLSTLRVLPKALAETSGLHCNENTMLSINDSGNAAVTYEIDYEGEIVSTTEINKKNIDWEAIAADKHYIYIADVGNNKGKRTDLSIIHYPINNTSPMITRTISYAANRVSGNIPYAHDFDAEAMVAANDTLLLFSKSWRSGIAFVYDITATSESLLPVAQIEGLPGVITGADYDETRNVYVFVGYKSDPFGNFAAFMAQASTNFALLNVWSLENYQQVEGVCVDKSGDYWFTEEATKTRAASLTKAMVSSD